MIGADLGFHTSRQCLDSASSIIPSVYKA